MDNRPLISFASELTAKKRLVVFDSDRNTLIAREILQRCVKGDNEETSQETPSTQESGEELVPIGRDTMEDEVLD